MRQHLWREVARQMREARGMALVAILLLAVGGAWAMLATSFLQWGRAGLLRAASQTVVVAVLVEGSEPAPLQAAVLARFPQAKCVGLSPRELGQALASWVGGASSEGLLPAAISVTVAASQAQTLKEFLRAQPSVAVVSSSQEWVDPALSGFSLALRLAGLLASILVFAFGALVVLAVRLLVLSHADEIAIMRLIGAHEEDIRAPYLVASTLLGVIGGGAAVGLALLGRGLLQQWVSLPPFSPTSLLLTVLAGGVAGALGAAVGVRSLPQEP